MDSSVALNRVGYAQVVGSASGGAANAGWFGDGSDGDIEVTGDMPLDVETDAGQIIKQYNNVTITQSGILRPAHRCNGMVLLVKGNLTVSGTITVDKCAPLLNPNENNAATEPHIVLCGSMTGGNAGRAGQSRNEDGALKPSGTPGIGFGFGGGYGSGSGSRSDPGGSCEPRPPIGTAIPYPAGKGVSFCGTGGSYYYSNYSDINHQYPGGAGPGGSGSVSDYLSGNYLNRSGNAGDAIGGGAIWIFVKGKMRIEPGAKITANGGNGGAGAMAYYSNTNYTTSGGGGGGGGGIICIVHTGDYINQGSVTANGGHGGAGGTSPYNSTLGVPGADGSVGTIKICKISELT